MTDDIRVRVAGRSFGYGGETYTNGDELEVDEETLENHPRTLEPLQSPSTESVDENDGDDEGEGDAEDVESYGREDLEEMEYEELQALASEADTDAVDGRSSREDIVEALADE